MDNVIPLPGVRPPAQTIADLPKGTKAILVRPEIDGYIATMVPAASDSERQVRKNFPDAQRALRYARLMLNAYPGLYRFVIDETGSGQSDGRAA